MDKRFYTSQYGQEKVIESLTKDHKGIFIEVGAWNGIELSNTYYLEKIKDWTGILIEPIPDKVEQLKHNRWSHIFDGCLYDKNQLVEFHHILGYSEMASGIMNEYHPKYKERILNEVNHFKLQINTIQKNGITLNSLCDKYNLKHIDFLSLDCQSLELNILKSYDPTKNTIKTICLDMNGFNVDEIKEWMEDNNYALHWKHDKADEYIFINVENMWSWEY